MMNLCQFSNNTKNYLEQYQSILQDMFDQMSAVVPTHSISADFITQMIPHHRAAIAMSYNLLRYTTNIQLQNIAQNIIVSQQKSIQDMMQAYGKCRSCVNSLSDLSCYAKQNDCIMSNMFYEMNVAHPNNNIDINFIREMIPHHKGAVCMSENALKFPICMELIPQLEEIITSQKEGIKEMQELQRQIECC